MVNKKIIFTGLIILIAIIAVGTVYFLMQGKGTAVTTSKEVNALVLYHWWTAPGEAQAISALIGVFSAKYPDTAVMPTSIVGGIGGGGTSLLNIVRPLVLAGQAPDAFQSNAGYGAKQYYDLGILAPVDNLWTSQGLSKVIPSIVQDMCQFNGHYYAVPVDIHRDNVVWYNKPLLVKNGIDLTTLTTWQSFFAACDKLKAAGVTYPIQMDGSWTAETVFEGILASEGINFYQNWINGKVTDPQDPKLLDALNTFKTFTSYINPDNANLGWDTAVSRIISGQGAFNVMGDWADGVFIAANMTYNKDYGTFPVPGTSNMYGLVIDSFLEPKTVPHPTNANNWLEVVGSKEGQDAFNPLKGSISARTDTDVTKYNAYQQAAIADFWKVKYMYPAISSGVPHASETDMQNILAQLIQDQDVNKAAATFTDDTKGMIGNYTIIWSLT